jgi:hypothetical protein
MNGSAMNAKQARLPGDEGWIFACHIDITSSFSLRSMIENGGMRGLLAKHLKAHPVLAQPLAQDS